jgi:hypothetical protein
VRLCSRSPGLLVRRIDVGAPSRQCVDLVETAAAAGKHECAYLAFINDAKLNVLILGRGCSGCRSGNAGVAQIYDLTAEYHVEASELVLILTGALARLVQQAGSRALGRLRPRRLRTRRARRRFRRRSPCRSCDSAWRGYLRRRLAGEWSHRGRNLAGRTGAWISRCVE